MKLLNLIAILMITNSVIAAKDPVVQDAQPSLRTEMNFEGLVVNGKYQYADEAIAQVEDDKTLDDLLSLRNDFKDRLRKETKRK